MDNVCSQQKAIQKKTYANDKKKSYNTFTILNISSIYLHFLTTHLTLCVAENNGLCDGQRVIEVTECVKFPLLALDSDEELLDSFQRQLVTFHKNADRVCHKLTGHFQYFMRQRRRQQHNLDTTNHTY